MTNLYKILPIGDWDEAYIQVIVATSLDNCRKSIDGQYVLVKLPMNIQSVDDVPEEWKTAFNANKPYLNPTELKVEMNKPNWSHEL